MLEPRAPSPALQMNNDGGAGGVALAWGGTLARGRPRGQSHATRALAGVDMLGKAQLGGRRRAWPYKVWTRFMEGRAPKGKLGG